MCVCVRALATVLAQYTSFCVCRHRRGSSACELLGWHRVWQCGSMLWLGVNADAGCECGRFVAAPLLGR